MPEREGFLLLFFKFSCWKMTGGKKKKALWVFQIFSSVIVVSNVFFWFQAKRWGCWAVGPASTTLALLTSSHIIMGNEGSAPGYPCTALFPSIALQGREELPKLLCWLCARENRIQLPLSGLHWFFCRDRERRRRKSQRCEIAELSFWLRMCSGEEQWDGKGNFQNHSPAVMRAPGELRATAEHTEDGPQGFPAMCRCANSNHRPAGRNSTPCKWFALLWTQLLSSKQNLHLTLLPALTWG